MKTPDFIIIPYQLIVDDKLAPADRILYGVIYWLGNGTDGICYASNQYLSDVVKITPVSIKRSLKRLEDNNFIKRHFYDKNKRNRERIKCLVTYKNEAPYGATKAPNGAQSNITTKEIQDLVIKKVNSLDRALKVIVSQFVLLGYKFDSEDDVDDLIGWLSALRDDYPDRDFVKNAKAWYDYYKPIYENTKKRRNHRSSFRNWIAKEFSLKKITQEV